MWLNVGSLLRSQSSGTGPSASCGYCCRLCPTRGWYPGKIRFYRAPGGKWAQETCPGCPQQRYATEEPGNVQGPDRVWIVKRSCGYRARGVSVRGIFVLSRNLGYKIRGVAMWLNVVLIPGSLPRTQSSGTGSSSSCGYCCAIYPTGGRYPGGESFYRAPGGKWAQKTCAGCPQQRYAMGKPSKVQGWERVVIIEEFCGYRARGVSSRGKFVLSRNMGYKTRRSPCG